MRPLYESAKDLANELQVSSALAIKWDCNFFKMPMSYHVDWMIMKDKPKAFAELKCRNNQIGRYPTFLLSLSKWMKGKDLAKEVGIPFLIIVRWTDGVFYHEAGSSEVTYGVGGRRDREDAADVEPVVLIPIEKFTRII